MYMFKTSTHILFLLFILLSCKLGAQSFTPGNLSVLQVNGTTSAASQVQICEYDPITHNQVSPVNSWQLPSTGSGNLLTLSGSAGSDGNMTLDSERTHLIIPGYNAASATSNVVSGSGANRIIASFDPAGDYSFVANVPQTQAFNGNNFRSATGAGSRYYGVGAGSGGTNGVRQMLSGSAISIVASGSTRTIAIYNGQLYYSLSTGIYMAGTGIPVASGTSSTLVTPASASITAAYNFALSPDNNTLYIADEVAGILKCTRTGGSGVFSAPAVLSNIPVHGLTVDFTVSPVVIYGTSYLATGTNALIRITDGSSTVDTLAVAPSGSVFKGVTFSPANSAKIVGGGINICSGSSATLTFYGNPGDSVTYSVNGVNNGLRIANNGVYTLNTGALIANNLDSVYTYSLVNITGSMGTVAVSGSVSLTVSPSIPAPFSGILSVCSGGTFSLSDVTPGGTWSSSDPSIASISAGSGIGGSAGVTTISYSLSNVCGPIVRTAAFTVNPLPATGTMGGPSSVCAGGSITLTSTGTIGTGSWSGGTALATINSTSGQLIAGSSTGTAIITFTATTATCGSVSTTLSITINPLPNAGVVSGTDSVCVGSTISLSSTGTTGGTWVTATPTIATVSSGGVTGGVANGSATIRYRVTTPTCGSDSSQKVILVRPLPNAGTIGGPTSVCAGAAITLTNTGSVGAGTWSSGSSLATVNSTTGVLTAGSTTGTAVVTYTATTPACGSATTTANITINALPNAGTITGADSVCVGSTISLTSTGTALGQWSSLAPAIATINTSGVAGGVATGNTVIKYKVLTPSCGSDSTTKTIHVNPLPNAGTITGATSECAGAVITLSATGTTGVGSFSTSSSLVSVDPLSGAVSAGMTAGTATITYTAHTYSCGNSTTTYSVTVNPLPDAGSISGTDTLCPGTTATLASSGMAGGTWLSSVPLVATVSASGIVTALAPGSNTISYRVTTATCGSDTATFPLYVRSLPDAGSVAGGSTVCVGFTLTLTDSSPGGVWSSSNPAIASVAGGIVTGQSTGTAVISYAVTNICTTAVATATVTVVPAVIPPITGGSVVCVGANLSLSNPAAGGTWLSSNTSVANVSASGIVTGVSQGVSVISYTVLNSCGLITDTQAIQVNPLPVAGTIVTGSGSIVCSGSQLVLTNATTGGIWSSSNTAVAVVSSTGVVSGGTAGSAIIYYTVTNSCGAATDTAMITVNTAPGSGLAPQITTTSPSWLCDGTMYQNFGTSSAAPAGEYYQWSASNAQVYATGAGAQYCLVNFPFAGEASIYLATYATGNICPVRDTFIVEVGNSAIDHPTVSYNSGVFSCDQAQASYQWGYDDALTLAPTVLTGETNQQYSNAAPDFANKYYWVITERLLCQQKTYYRVPAGIVNVGNAANYTAQVYPNPTSGALFVKTAAPVAESGTITVTDVTGRLIANMPFEANTVAHLSLHEAAGIYMVTVRSQHIMYTAKVILK